MRGFNSHVHCCELDFHHHHFDFYRILGARYSEGILPSRIPPSRHHIMARIGVETQSPS